MNCKMLIDAQWCGASDGATFNNYNPYTNELIGTVPSATKEDVDRAIDSAYEGQKEWAAIPYLKRSDILERFIHLLDVHQDEIAQINTMEGGKPITQSRTEVASVKRIFHAYLSAGETFCGESLPLNTDIRGFGDMAFTINEPLGVIACIGPYNFPLSIMAYKIAAALVAGNSIIMKPASDTPMGTLMIARLLLEAGVSPRAVQCVTGSGSKIGGWFGANPKVAGQTLTGSTAVGVQLMRSASEHLQRVMMELGGNDPLVVFADANIDLAAKEAFAGRIRHAGQVCCSNKRLIIHESVKEEFTEKLLMHIDTLKILPPTDPASEYSCLTSERAAIEVEKQIKMTIDAGAKLVRGGTRNGAFISPTVLTDVTGDMDIARNMEIFGAVFPIISFSDFDEAIALANNSIYGLSSGVMTQDIKTAMKAATRLQAGTCVINGSGNYHQNNHAFGGVKMSGLGREGALYALREVTQPKTVVLKRIFE